MLTLHAVWAINNRTPYAAGRTWGRNQDGVHEWLVAVRATFDIRSAGRLVLADEQPEPLLAAEYNGEDGVSSLRYEADLVAPKPTTDVVINGTAYAPGGRALSEFSVGVRVEGVQKVLRVLGTRVWYRGALGVAPSAPVAVSEVPIIYERAYGGYDSADPEVKNHRLYPRNPVGIGVVADARRLLDRPVHNFEYPDGDPAKRGPAGFGAIASYWSPRSELQGTYDATWEAKRSPLLPSDWDPKSLLCSPEDQRPIRHLRGGERVQLFNLTRDGFLQFDLPRIYPVFTTYFSTVGGRRSEEHRARLETVIIEPDHSRLALVWVTSLLVHQDEDYLEETVIREKAYI
jgi:hypothetical protein